MEEQDTTKNDWIAYTVFGEKSNWGQIMCSALGWWVSPLILIAAKIIGKNIQFGVWEHGKFKTLFRSVSLKNVETFQKNSSITTDEVQLSQ